ncbi:MAG: extracellular solute-binding protein [Verrucomicrobia bacterium]|nr:extracellular solute-binding protein [Verrucomicrobiota bacterium]
MKKLFAPILMLVLLVFVACAPVAPVAPNVSTPAPAAATAAASTEAACEPVKIVYGAQPLGANYTQAFYDTLYADFEAENPCIKIEQLLPASAGFDSILAYFKSLIAAGEFPDSLTCGADCGALGRAGLLVPFEITDAVKQIKGYEQSMQGGLLYTLPSQFQPVGLVFYNKNQYAQAGITELPKTLDEMDAVLAKLKAAGFAPIVTSGDWVPSIFLDMLSATVIGKNPHFLSDIKAGKVKYAEGDLLKAFQHYETWVKNGYLIDGAAGLTYDQLEPAFFAERGASYPMGIWFTASAEKEKANLKFEVGVYLLPSLEGNYVYGARTAPCGVSSLSEHRKEAVTFCEYLSLGKGHAAIAKADGMFSNLQNPPDLGFSGLQLDLEKQLATATITWQFSAGLGDEAVVSGIGAVLGEAGQAVLQGKSALEALTMLDDYVAAKLQTP